MHSNIRSTNRVCILKHINSERKETAPLERKISLDSHRSEQNPSHIRSKQLTAVKSVQALKYGRVVIRTTDRGSKIPEKYQTSNVPVMQCVYR